MAILARALLWLLLAAGSMMTLSWAALHWWIVPRIESLRPQLEAHAGQMLGRTLRIGGIDAYSGGLLATLEMRDVELLDQQGRVVLHLDTVIGALSPISLWRLGFEQIYLEQPELDIRRERDGRLFVAGIELSESKENDGRGVRWLLDQTEILIRGGTLTWTDQQRDVAPLRLEQVDVTLRNGAIRHRLHMQATPPPELGARFVLMGELRESLASQGRGLWQQWSGELYAQFDRVDVAQLRRYALPQDMPARGHGALRLWVDLKRGQWAGVQADVALTDARIALKPRQAPLAMRTLSGRLGARPWDSGYEVFTEGLRFQLEEGLRWPGGDIRLRHRPQTDQQPERGELLAHALDIQTLARIGDRLPLDPKANEMLGAYAPRGRVEHIDLKWTGPMEAPSRYEARGRMSGLEIRAQTEERAQPGEEVATLKLLSPGVQRLGLEFDVTQDGGRATLSVKDGRIDLPGLFEQPLVMLERLDAVILWRGAGARMEVEIPRLAFSNADAAGVIELKWGRGKADQGADALGEIDLSGRLERGDAAKIVRYLPKAMAPKVRHYLGESLREGRLSDVDIRVRGALRDFPFADGRQGQFRIAGHVEGGNFAYVPESYRPQGAKQWPALTRISGDVVVSGKGWRMERARTGLAGVDSLWFHAVEAEIADFAHEPTLRLHAKARGALDEVLLALMKKSPLADMTGGALAQARAMGPAQYEFELNLPLQDMSKTSVKGQVELTGNELQIGPKLPRVTGLRGVVHFSERGFAVGEGMGRALGGNVRIEGGTMTLPGSPADQQPILRVTGVATAEGLQQATELGALARLAKHASGSTRYSFAMGMNRGLPELNFETSFRGMALDLPEPLRKPVQTALPLRLKTAVQRVEAVDEPIAGLSDRITLQFGDLLKVDYRRARDEDGAMRVVSGTVGLGLARDETLPMPATGEVMALLRLDSVDLDVWRALVSVPDAEDEAANEPAAKGRSMLQDYLPTAMAIEAGELTVAGRKLRQVVLGGTREGGTWRANVDARELSGYVEYRQTSDDSQGAVYARLARLVLAPAQAAEVESLLDEQPKGIPALDIAIQDMELRGRKLGRVEIEAVNRDVYAAPGGQTAREWRLNRLQVLMPEAVLTATGNWTAVQAQAPVTLRRSGPSGRRTALKFKLDIHNAGGLLGRFGMGGVIGNGSGSMQGQVSWMGSPMTLDKASLNGDFNINVENGQFLKAEPGLAKLLGVLSLQSLPRRLSLDFRDVFTDGFSFDFVRGDVRVAQGVASSNNLQMKGVNAAVLMDGEADIVRETQNLKVVVVPEINAGTASLIATWINPAVGLTTFMAQLLLRRPLIESATQTFLISGSWADPKVARPQASSPPPSEVGQ